MRVVKVLNNSLVLALDDQGCETILMGKGIGFHKAAGEQFDKTEVEKVFILKDRSISRSIIRLAADIDSVYFEITKSVIDYAKEKYHMVLLDPIYLSLTDHLSFAVQRVKDGIEIPNFYTTDLRRFNPNEYDIGLYALKLVKKQLGVILPEDEAGNIAFHFMNVQVNKPMDTQNQKVKKLTVDLLNLVKYYYKLVYKEDSVIYTRFETHVRLFAQRLISGNQLTGDPSHIMYDQITKVCQEEMQCVERIETFIEECFGVHLTNQESMYLAMHIHLILEDEERNRS